MARRRRSVSDAPAATEGAGVNGGAYRTRKVALMLNLLLAWTGRAVEVTGARRSSGRRRVLEVNDVADDLDRPNTNQRRQGVHNKLANKIG